MRRRVLAVFAVAGAAVYAVRRRGRRGRRERVDLYFEDGSMVSLRSGSEEARRLLALARDVLAAAR
jgi:hypothetical protein